MQLKRSFDFLVAAFGLVLTSPILCLIAVAIKLDSPGPVFFRSKRVGKDGALFVIYKFRTMIANAAALGSGITIRDDPRVTRIGSFLRRTKLDEVPQLWNVVRGEMSLVGPRPEDPRYLKYYSPAQRALLQAAPGMTSAASIAFRNEQEMLEGAEWEQFYIETVLPKKLDLDLAYMQHQTFASDLLVLAQTFWVVGRGGVTHRVSEFDH